MNRKFKMGDRVKFLGKNNTLNTTLKVGDIVTIKEVSPNPNASYPYRVQEDPDWKYEETNFELVEVGTKQSYPEAVGEVTKACNCDLQTLMRYGCKCGSIKPYELKVS